MKKYSLLLLILAFVLAACNNDGGTEETPAPRPTPTVEEAVPTQDAYPTQPDQPTVPAAGYPSPESEAWLILPAGKQCTEALAYPTSDSAVAALEQAGVSILAVEETELIVCDGCECPTSTHYRVLLAAEDIPVALSLGWKPE